MRCWWRLFKGELVCGLGSLALGPWAADLRFIDLRSQSIELGMRSEINAEGVRSEINAEE